MQPTEYGVVVCPQCERPRAVNLSHKTATCQRCGKQFKLRTRKVMYRSPDAREAAVAVAEISRRLHEG
ncbi:MAG: DUF1922 domain-containing protein [Thermoplasmatota archaeon]